MDINELRRRRKELDEEIAKLWTVEKEPLRAPIITNQFDKIYIRDVSGFCHGFRYEKIKEWIGRTGTSDECCTLFDYSSFGDSREQCYLLRADDQYYTLSYNSDYYHDSGCDHVHGLIHRDNLIKLVEDLNSLKQRWIESMQPLSGTLINLRNIYK